MKTNQPLFLPFFLLIFNYLPAQTDSLRLNLTEVVALAQSDAPDALIAETRMKNRFWFYKSVLADFKPAISLDAELPDLNRSIDIITQNNGTDVFIQRSQMRNRVGLNIQQSIAATGGTVFVGTGLQRIDIFQSKSPDIVNYFSTPFYLGFIQPVFGLNTLKWSKKIEPLRYKEANLQYAEEMENIGYESSSLFFDLLIAQLNFEAARRDKANADTLLNISKGRFEVGRIAETELLQIELSAMNANAAMQQARLEMQTGTERLRNFLGIRQSTNFALEPPTEIPSFKVTPDDALRFAREYRSDFVSYQRRLAEADREVAQAKANSGLQFDLTGQFSLSQTGNQVNDAYNKPLNNERLQLSLRIPIADWGKAKARLETAQTNRELEIITVEQEQINFEQEILLKVKQFELLREQVTLALRAYEISQKREEMTRNRYYIGKIGVTDLNIAISEKENARQGYMTSLRSFWEAHYDLRRSTLYDFERNVPLVRKLNINQ